MTSNRKPLFLLLAVVMLAGVFFSQRHLNRQREEMKLTYRADMLENAPPFLAFTTAALGGFRGLISSYLWLRMNELQMNEKYFEMVQLADWITKMQPRFPAVWVHQAWNMSYNVSVKFPDHADRWLWVQRGITLLRDEGLKYNPEEPLLYHELAWHFQHKMGANLDNAHNYYKVMWAAEMNQLLGAKPDFDALINPQTDEQKERTRRLREKYKMDPAAMKRVDQIYGPLEWRLPETHAIYWGWLGLEKTKDNAARRDLFIKLRRVVYQSMQLAFMRGRLVENKYDRAYETSPNLDITAKVNQSYVDQLAEATPDMKENVANGHRNFLKTAITQLYMHNREKEAVEWLRYFAQHYADFLRRTEPSVIAGGVNFDKFVLMRVQEQMGTGGKDKTQSTIEGMLARHFYELAIGEDDRAMGFERMARRIYNLYLERSAGAEKGRVDLPPYEKIKGVVLEGMLERSSPQLAARLVSALGLPPSVLTNLMNRTNRPPVAPRTNGPATNLPPPKAVAPPGK